MLNNPAKLAGAALAALCAASSACAGAATPAEPTRASLRASPTKPQPVLQVSRVTGHERVATLAMPIYDRARRRELMLQAWYPTRAAKGHIARYYSPAVAQLVAAADHVPVSIVAAIGTHSLSGGRPAPGAHAVLLYSPGSGEMRNDATSLAEDLASHGYLVLALDHPGESRFVQYPDGHIVRGTFVDTGAPSNTREVKIRMADTAAVVRALPALDHHGPLAGSLNLRRVGMFGFSLGGATAAAAMRALPQIKAGVDLDGTLYGTPLSTRLSRPFMLVGDGWHDSRNDDTWRAGWHQLTGYRREIKLRNSGHLSFTDVASFIDSLGHRSRYPVADQRLLLGAIPAPRAIAATRQLLAAFFDHFLQQRPTQGFLDNPHRRNPDLVRIH